VELPLRLLLKAEPELRSREDAELRLLDPISR